MLREQPQPRFTPSGPATAVTQSHFASLQVTETCKSPSKGQHGTGTVLSPCTPSPAQGLPLQLSPVSSGFSSTVTFQARGLSAPPDPLSCWRALKISEGLGERVFKAQAAAAGDAIPGLPSAAASEPQAGWSTVPPAYVGVDLGWLLPGVELQAPGGCPDRSLPHAAQAAVLFQNPPRRREQPKSLSQGTEVPRAWLLWRASWPPTAKLPKDPSSQNPAASLCPASAHRVTGGKAGTQRTLCSLLSP